MKIRLNKANLAAIPAEVRSLVLEWRERWGKAAISLVYRDRFYIEEDARYVGFSPDLKKAVSVRAGGEWAGPTNLMPGSDCPLPPGCTAVATGIFLGEPWLTIFHNPAHGDRDFCTWQFRQLAAPNLPPL